MIIPSVYETGRATEPVLKGAENLTSSRIRHPDRAARNESQYRLSSSGPLHWLKTIKFKMSLFTTTGAIRVTVQWEILWTRQWAFGFRKRRGEGGGVRLCELTSISQEMKYSMTLNCYCADTDKIITSSWQTTTYYLRWKMHISLLVPTLTHATLCINSKREETPYRYQPLGALCQGQQNTAWLLWTGATNSSGHLSKQSASYFSTGRLS